jgi:hypothetical protein
VDGADRDHMKTTLEDLDLKAGDTILFHDLSFNHFVVLDVKNARSDLIELRVMSLANGDVFEIGSCVVDTAGSEILRA